MVGQRILQEIGQTGIPVVNCSNACATGATAFREAWTSIKAGLYDVVLAVGCLLYTSPSPRDRQKSRMPSSA